MPTTLTGLLNKTQSTFLRPPIKRIKRKNVIISLFFLFSLILSFTIFLTTFQRLLIYCERPFSSTDEAEILQKKSLNIHGFWINANVRGYWLPASSITSSTSTTSTTGPPKNTKTILYFHGQNAKLEWVISTFEKWNEKFPVNIMSVSYRSFGRSKGGPPHQEGVLKDAEAALRYLCTPLENRFRSPEDKDHGSELDKIPVFEKVDVFGHSLGGAVSIHLTALHPDKIAHLVVENTFIKIVRTLVGRYRMGFLAHLLSFCSLDPWDNEQQLEALADRKKKGKWVPPILFISGLKDRKIPHWHTETLYKGVKDKLSVSHQKIEHRCHNSCYLDNGAFIGNFLEE